MCQKSIFVVCLTAMFSLLLFAGCGQDAPKNATPSDWPKGEKITMIIPFNAGGSADTMMRQINKYWEQELGSNIIIENREGAAGMVGATTFLKKPADGLTVFAGTQLYLSANIVLQNAQFKLDDFDIINFQQFDPITICVREDSPYKTFDDLVAAMKEKHGQLKWGTIYGGPLHLAGELLKDKLGVDFTTVNYDSGNGYRTALLGGHVDFVISNANGDRAIKGKARVLAVADTEKSPIWPDAPTLNEVLEKYGVDFPPLGSVRFIAVSSALKKNYPERYQRLVNTYKKAFESPEYQELLKNNGEIYVSHYYGPEESNKMNHDLHALVEKYKDRLKKTK